MNRAPSGDTAPPTCDETCGAAVSLKPDGAHGELRCGCGSLLARLVSGGVELKCRRCKRTFLIPLQSPEIPD